MMNGTVISGWTPQCEHMVGSWRLQLLARACAHEESTTHFTRCHKVITVPNILFSALLGSMGMTTLAAATGADDDSTADTAHTWYTSILSMVIALLTALDNALSYGVKASSHAMVARTYTKMATNIEVQLVRTPAAREDPHMFIDKLINTMEQLRETSPEIPGYILRKQPLLASPDRDATATTRSRPTPSSPAVPAQAASVDGYAGAAARRGRRYLQQHNAMPPARSRSWRGVPQVVQRQQQRRGQTAPTPAPVMSRASLEMAGGASHVRHGAPQKQILSANVPVGLSDGTLSDGENESVSTRDSKEDAAEHNHENEPESAVVNFLCQNPKGSVIIPHASAAYWSSNSDV